MTLPARVTHDFVEFVPAELEAGKIYVSIPYSTAVHSCLCGCGMKVVTPIKPNKWTLTYDGESISLSPSVGNWSFPCRSHYVIRGGRVIEAAPMSDASIAYGRARDATLTNRYHGARPETAPSAPAPAKKRGFWQRLFGGD